MHFNKHSAYIKLISPKQLKILNFWIDGHGGVIYIYKNTSQMSDADVIDYMGYLIQSNPIQLSSEIKEVNYKYDGMTEE